MRRMLRRLILLLCLVVLFLPLYWMFVGSLSRGSSLLKIPPDFFPRPPTGENYRYMLTGPLLGTWIGNTLVLILTGPPIAVLISVMAGYALSWRPRGWKIIVGLQVFGVIVPRVALTIPLFFEAHYLGLIGTTLGAYFPLLAYPVGVLLAMGYFRGIPKELFEEAALSSASDLQVLWHIAIPSAAPLVGLMLLGKGMEPVSDYLWQSLILQRPYTQTFIIGLMERAATAPMQYSDTGLQCAAGILLFLPFVGFYLLTARYFAQDPLRGLR